MRDVVGHRRREYSMRVERRLRASRDSVYLSGGSESAAMNWAPATSGFDEIFEARGHAPPPLRAAHRHPRVVHPRGRRPARAPAEARPDEPRASPSPSTARRRGSSASSRSTSCRASSPPREWKLVQDGLVQRITALNLFLLDIYQDAAVPARTAWCPPELVFSRKEYKRELRGLVPLAQGVHPRGRHRHHPGRARRVPRARGQLPRAERRELRAREPHAAEPRVPGVLRRPTPCGPIKDYPTLLLETLALRRAAGRARAR